MDGAWCISDEDHIDTTQIYCLIECKVNDPAEIPDEPQWLLYNEIEREHLSGQVVKISMCFISLFLCF